MSVIPLCAAGLGYLHPQAFSCSDISAPVHITGEQESGDAGAHRLQGASALKKKKNLFHPVMLDVFKWFNVNLFVFHGPSLNTECGSETSDTS